ncbi:MAG: response regulator [Candidatus Omnitrophota bacterium]
MPAPAKKILIVEDEPEMRQLLSMELGTEGYEIHQACDGEEGFLMAKEIQPDLIISDVLMPKIDGNTLFKALRETDFGKKIPFIVLTARVKMHDYFEMVHVDDFIEKPFQADEVIKKVARVLKKNGAVTLEEEKTKKEISGKNSGTEILIQNEMIKERNVQDGTDAVDSRSGAPAGSQGATVSKQPALKGRKVIVLEDNMDAFHELERIFADRAATLQLVTNQQECVEEANRLVPDLIILKNIFKKIDAEEIANNLKALPRFQRIPIIIYTNIGEKSDVINMEGVRSSAFVLSQEGREMIRKAVQILED